MSTYKHSYTFIYIQIFLYLQLHTNISTHWASGLEWTIVDDEQLAEHQVLDNPELAKALESKTKFTQEEWKDFKIKEEWKDFKINFTQKELEDFKIKDLSIGHVVQWGPFYFKPDTEGSVVLGTYNTYPTTINALLSGMQKLMWVAPVPKDRFVYRGLGGLNLPETFFAQDQLGLCVLSPPHNCCVTL